MENFRFTPFNGITLLVMALTIVLVWRRFAGVPANWPLAYYAALVAYTIVFSGGLNPYWVVPAWLAAWPSAVSCTPREFGWWNCFRSGM